MDVIPHQDLRNPLPSDGDATAFGDLPYACAAPYSRNIGDFRAPTRVVGRLPDLTAAINPQYLIRLLQRAAEYVSSPRKSYESYLGISARVWSASTALSLENTVGSSAELQVSPSAGPKWTAAQLRRRSVFINCHGAAADSHFYGQRGNDYPIAHDASYLGGRVAEGSVVAAECCYGAELYDPNLSGGQQAICNTYLAGGAYGFFGSSTIAYGPSSGWGSSVCWASRRSTRWRPPSLR